MKSMIKELWHGNVCPQTDSRNNSPEMKQLMEYMARHHEEFENSFTDEQKETLEKFEDCMNEMHSITERDAFLLPLGEE